MNHKPILYSAPMVRAILAGCKTQTRRVISPQPHTDGIYLNWKAMSWTRAWHPAPIWVFAPYQPDDTLWCRESWRVGAWSAWDGLQVEYRADGSLGKWLEPPEDIFDRLWIDSTVDALGAGLTMDEDGYYCWDRGQTPTRWRPSIFMPRWASRITQKVTAVRAVRVQDISEADAIAEGVESVAEYAKLWDAINGKSGHTWASNPWVWAYTTTLLTP